MEEECQLREAVDSRLRIAVDTPPAAATEGGIEGEAGDMRLTSCFEAFRLYQCVLWGLQRGDNGEKAATVIFREMGQLTIANGGMVSKWFGAAIWRRLIRPISNFFYLHFSFLLFEVCIILFYHMSPFGLHEDRVPRIQFSTHVSRRHTGEHGGTHELDVATCVGLSGLSLWIDFTATSPCKKLF